MHLYGERDETKKTLVRKIFINLSACVLCVHVYNGMIRLNVSEVASGYIMVSERYERLGTHIIPSVSAPIKHTYII